MRALAELGSRICGHLVRGESVKRYDEMTDAELYARCTCPKFKDFGEMEQAAILDVRAQVVADPKAWAAAYLAEPEGVDKELVYALFTFTHRAAGPTGDKEAERAFEIAAYELERAGILPWYEVGRESLSAIDY